MGSKIVALIPARGGSKRIPKKNIKLLGGKPLIQWSIEVAQDLNLPVFVSTEDFDIAKMSIKCGCQVILRPGEFATDSSGDYEVINHAIWQTDCDILVYLRPTTPFRDSQTVWNAVQFMMVNVGVTSLRSVEEMPESAEKCFYRGDNGQLWPITLEDRTDLPNQMCQPTFHPNGYVDIVRREVVHTGRLWGAEKYGYVTEPVVELDTVSQWEEAERRIERGK